MEPDTAAFPFDADEWSAFALAFLVSALRQRRWVQGLGLAELRQLESYEVLQAGIFKVIQAARAGKFHDEMIFRERLIGLWRAAGYATRGGIDPLQLLPGTSSHEEIKRR